MKLASMTCSAIIVLMCGAVCFGRQAASKDDEQAVLRADALLALSLRNTDQKSVGLVLDQDFEWTTADGETRDKAQSLANLFSLSLISRTERNVRTYFYGQLELIAGEHQNARFVRIWVKRPDGWRALIYLDTPMPARAASTGTANNRAAANRGEDSGSGDCENPCRSVPFTPITEAAKAVLSEWQKTKIDEWHPDAQDWATHIADEFMIINNNSARNKAERVALAQRQEEAGIGAPGAPILSMTMSDFGNAVVMISHHAPYGGGKPYYNVRVFVNRDGHWPLVWSQQTTIQSAAPLPATK